ncbi:zinc finger MYM-type protein 4 [Parasteatoda tepidariorum]|uniref:zinc finger MYM-type protein 4 n=1 Tax=Parasteatoda tepidariorum TaxID=114398 RepID=UPI001C720DCB|nr:zinc finger MYM-type protein 4 [Parasteatoda tepidariorum]XP_015924943.2 zinc finger MYM-type protein 4 [Parasteatoda tepidariorum]XP_015924952.2 zinc finger MYM-type protein 4 [Parasteatoda tepidariorum]
MDEVMEIVEVTSLKDPSSKDNNGIIEASFKDDGSSKQNAKHSDDVTSENNGDASDIQSNDTTKKDHVLDDSTHLETNHNDTEKQNSYENHIDSPKSNSNDSSKIEDSVKINDSVSNESNEAVNKTEENCKTESDMQQETELQEEKKSEPSSSMEQVKENDVMGEDAVKYPDKDDTGKDASPKNSIETTDIETTDVVKKKDDSTKKKKGKICVVCGKKRKIEFRIHFQGKVQLLCSDQCYKQFKENQSESKAETVAKPAEPVQDSFCPQCQKLIFPNQGYYPVVGEIKPLCSEDCVRKYQENNGPPRKCSQCENKVEDKNVHLTWETMIFCGEDCLGKYQSFLGSHCTCCQAPVQQASLGKYCVCFGSDIRQFCSGSCLDDFKKGLKVCTFCQTDLSAGTEGFLAPVGDKGQFKDFCSQSCMERYETMNNLSKTAPETQECAHCKKQGTFKIQVPYNEKKYFLCCDSCVAGLRCTLKKSENVCASCHRFFECRNDLNSNKENDFKFKMDGLYKFFCSKTCMTTYVLSHRRITQCLFCKVKKYNFDMIEKVDRSDGQKIYCSLNCLSLHRVNANAASSKSIRCDNCSKTQPAQYHLTMSDGSIRNFCAYNCVLAFQNQFTSVPALTTTSMTRQLTTPVQTLKTTSALNSPVIANVVSLAQPRTSTPVANKPLVPQTLVSVRPTRQPVAVFTTKTQVSTVTSPSVPVVQPNSQGSQVMREVIIQPPAPKSVKNKTVWCKPIMQTKAINTKSSACHKAVQTDDSPRPIILPVPIPVYVPTPLHMFSRPVPCPVPFPVPIPVPIIIPASKEQVCKQLKKYQENISCNSLVKDKLDTDQKSPDAINSESDDTPDGCTKENQKRTLSSPIHSKHKKLKSDASVDSSSPSCEEENPQNSIFDSFDDEEQTMLKVP